jgi:hypothetical protein
MIDHVKFGFCKNANPVFTPDGFGFFEVTTIEQLNGVISQTKSHLFDHYQLNGHNCLFQTTQLANICSENFEAFKKWALCNVWGCLFLTAINLTHFLNELLVSKSLQLTYDENDKTLAYTLQDHEIVKMMMSQGVVIPKIEFCNGSYAAREYKSFMLLDGTPSVHGNFTWGEPYLDAMSRKWRMLKAIGDYCIWEDLRSFYCTHGDTYVQFMKGSKGYRYKYRGLEAVEFIYPGGFGAHPIMATCFLAQKQVGNIQQGVGVSHHYRETDYFLYKNPDVKISHSELISMTTHDKSVISCSKWNQYCALKHLLYMRTSYSKSYVKRARKYLNWFNDQDYKRMCIKRSRTNVTTRFLQEVRKPVQIPEVEYKVMLGVSPPVKFKGAMIDINSKMLSYDATQPKKRRLRLFGDYMIISPGIMRPFYKHFVMGELKERWKNFITMDEGRYLNCAVIEMKSVQSTVSNLRPSFFKNNRHNNVLDESELTQFSGPKYKWRAYCNKLIKIELSAYQERPDPLILQAQVLPVTHNAFFSRSLCNRFDITLRKLSLVRRHNYVAHFGGKVRFASKPSVEQNNETHTNTTDWGDFCCTSTHSSDQLVIYSWGFRYFFNVRCDNTQWCRAYKPKYQEKLMRSLDDDTDSDFSTSSDYSATYLEEDPIDFSDSDY